VPEKTSHNFEIAKTQLRQRRKNGTSGLEDPMPKFSTFDDIKRMICLKLTLLSMKEATMCTLKKH
jgi:hypothetical protein